MGGAGVGGAEVGGASTGASGERPPLEDLQKLLKDYQKVNLDTECVQSVRSRVAEGESWLETLEYLYDASGIDMPNVRMLLESDGSEVYCVCRQPDDLQRLMLACDGCEVWYHIHCVGVSPTRAKALQAEGAEFICPTCCEARCVKYPFEPRIKQPPPKRIPRVHEVAALLHKADALSVQVAEAALLRKASARSRRWQREQVCSHSSHFPKCHTPVFLYITHTRFFLEQVPLLLDKLTPPKAEDAAEAPSSSGLEPGAGLDDAALQALYEDGERFRVECELMRLLQV